MKIEHILLITLVILAVPGLADRKSGADKNVTVIQSQSSADGTSQLSERLLEECIVSLPNPEIIDPVVTSESQFLKEINGDPSKNDFVKTFSATLEINYMIHQKSLIVVTTNSIQGQEPVMKVMEKKLQQTKQFVSSSTDGDLYAGRSHRQYYFSTPEGAKKDVQTRASAWIKQQSAVICKK
jgi:hypothetical protein